MDCAVYDTYVEKKDGKVMHFDVIVEKSTPHDRAIEYGKSYLEKCRPRRPKHDPGRMPILSYSKAPDAVEKEISSNGFYIQKMEGCT